MSDKSASDKLKKEKLVCIILAMVSTFCFCIENNTYVVSNEQAIEIGSKIGIILFQLKSAIKVPTYVGCFGVVLLYFAYRYMMRFINKNQLKWSVPFAFISSLVLLLCESYYMYDNWNKVFGNTTALFTSLIRGTGICIIVNFLFLGICNVKLHLEQTELNQEKKYSEYIFYIGILMLCWLPYIVIMFPGAMNPDTRDQLAQIVGNERLCWTARTVNIDTTNSLWNNHHPVFYTWILSWFVEIGRMIGSYPWAFEIYCVLQCILLAGTISCLLMYLKKRGISKRVCMLILGFFALNPVVPLYGMTVMKDTLFGILMLACVSLFYELFRNPKVFSTKKAFCLIIAAFLLMLVRNNGFYLLLMLLPVALWFYRKDKTTMKRILFIMILPLLVFQVGINGILFHQLKISQGSPREMMSVPFQQTARYIKEYGDTISEADEKVILKILSNPENSLQTIADKYESTRADSVKGMYNKNASSEDMKEYIKVWFKYLLKHPTVYIQAFLNLDYGWFTMDSKKDNVYYDGITDETTKEVLSGLESPEKLSSARNVISSYVKILGRLPFTAWLTEFSAYSWLYLVVLFVMCMRKKYFELLSCGLIFFNYLICFIGPVGYMRYVVPMLICAPWVFVLAFGEKEVIMVS